MGEELFQLLNLQSVLENRSFCGMYAVLVLVTAQCV